MTENPSRQPQDFTDIVNAAAGESTNTTKTPVVHSLPVAKPVSLYENDGDGGASVDGVRKLLTLSPMHDYFCRVAERNYGHLKRTNPVAALGRYAPRFQRVCVVLDLIYRGGLMTILLVSSVVLLAKGLLSPFVLP